MRKTLYYILTFTLLIGILVGCAKKPVNTSEKLQETSNHENGNNKEDREDLLVENHPNEPDNLGRTIPDISLQEIKASSTGIGSAAGIWAREKDIVVSDQKNHKLMVIDWDGNVLKEVGKLGMGPLEFTKPGDIFWDEKGEILYVLDIGNNRIQKLSYDLAYIGQISLKDLNIYTSEPFQSIAVDHKGNVYISLNMASPDQLNVYCISPDGTINKSEELFGGVLADKDGEIYAVETMAHTISESKVAGQYNVSFTAGQTYLYKMKGADMIKTLDFPYKYTPSNLLWIEDKVYIASSLWNLVESFKIEDEELVYLKTISSEIPFQENHDAYTFTLSYFGDTIFAADWASGNIYKFDL